MQFLNIALFLSLFIPSEKTFKIDFGEKTGGYDWQIVNDGVMGGLSEGTAYLTPESVVFQGAISLDNNGGFSSIRSRYSNYDLSSFEKVTIRYRGDGQSFGLRLQMHERFYLPYFKKVFEAKNNEWQTLTFQLSDFNEYVMGRTRQNQPSREDLKEIIRIGIITNDKKEGPFELEIDYILFE